jgi:hypothetical protein
MRGNRTYVYTAMVSTTRCGFYFIGYAKFLSRGYDRFLEAERMAALSEKASCFRASRAWVAAVHFNRKIE